MSMNNASKPTVICPERKPVSKEQLAVVSRSLDAYLESVWNEGGKGREVLEELLAEPAEQRKAA